MSIAMVSALVAGKQPAHLLHVLETFEERQNFVADLRGKRVLHVKGFRTRSIIKEPTEDKQDPDDKEKEEAEALQALQNFAPDFFVVDGDPWGEGFQIQLKRYMDAQRNISKQVPTLIWARCAKLAGDEALVADQEERSESLNQANEWVGQGFPVVVFWVCAERASHRINKLFGNRFVEDNQSAEFNARGLVQIMADPLLPWVQGLSHDSHRSTLAKWLSNFLLWSILAIESSDRGDKQYFQKCSFESAATGNLIFDLLDNDSSAQHGVICLGGGERVLLEIAAKYLNQNFQALHEHVAIFPFGHGDDTKYPLLPKYMGLSFISRSHSVTNLSRHDLSNCSCVVCLSEAVPTAPVPEVEEMQSCVVSLSNATPTAPEPEVEEMQSCVVSLPNATPTAPAPEVEEMEEVRQVEEMEEVNEVLVPEVVKVEEVNVEEEMEEVKAMPVPEVEKVEALEKEETEEMEEMEEVKEVMEVKEVEHVLEVQEVPEVNEVKVVLVPEAEKVEALDEEKMEEMQEMEEVKEVKEVEHVLEVQEVHEVEEVKEAMQVKQVKQVMQVKQVRQVKEVKALKDMKQVKKVIEVKQELPTVPAPELRREPQTKQQTKLNRSSMEKSVAANKSLVEKTLSANKSAIETVAANKSLVEKTLSANKSAIEKSVRTWIEAVTGHSGDDQTIAEYLKDGRVLCALVNAVKPGSIKKVNTSKLAFKQMENIAHFIKVARELGVPEASMFGTSDLYEEKNMGSVLRCVCAFAGVIQQDCPEFTGPHLGPAIRPNTKGKQQASRVQAVQFGSFDATFEREKPGADSQKPIPDVQILCTRPPESASTASLYAHFQPKLTVKVDIHLERGVCAWIEGVTFEVKGAQTTHKWLKSGEVLCRLANSIKPGLVHKINVGSVPFKQMENISFFRDAARQVGVPESSMFRLLDLYEEKDMESVIHCLQTFAGAVQVTCPEFTGPIFGDALKVKVNENKRLSNHWTISPNEAMQRWMEEERP